MNARHQKPPCACPRDDAGQKEHVADCGNRLMTPLPLPAEAKVTPVPLSQSEALTAVSRRLVEVSEERDALRARVAELEKQKNGAYSERNQCVAFIAKMARALGWEAGIAQHPAEDTYWDYDWRTIVLIETPTGQLSWHFHDSERHLLDFLGEYEGEWDGHTTEEKYGRMRDCLVGPLRPWPDAEWDVRAFFREMALHMPCSFAAPTKPVRELRANLLMEEAVEFRTAAERGNVVDMIDGAVDAIYIALGFFAEVGLPFAPFWAEVHRSNMAKAGGPRREDGKVLKPPGWKPPDIAGVLRRVLAEQEASNG